MSDGRPIAEAWADELCDGHAADPALQRLIDLHVADVALAYFAGRRSPEAQALARALAGCAPAAVGSMVRRTECDDIHVASCMTPGSVVVPVALHVAALAGASAERFDQAVAAGYTVGLRLGTAIGGAAALTSGIWPTYFAAPVMAAATAAIGLDLGRERTAAAIGLAAAGAGGRIGRPAGNPSGRWYAAGDAIAKGCRAALAAAEGFRGDAGLISADWLSALGNSGAIRPEALLAGTRLKSVAAVGFKPFVAARQTINAVFAFQRVVAQGVAPETMSQIEVGVPSLNAAMVARPAVRGERLSTIANMHLQIAAAALRPDLLYRIERDLEPGADLLSFAERIRIVADPALDRHLPDVWAGRVEVTASARTFRELCTTIPGDPGDEPGTTGIIENKIARMVPEPDRALCAALLAPVEAAGRAARLGSLWQAMRAGLPQPHEGSMPFRR